MDNGILKQKYIEDGFIKLGLQKGMAIEVHSSLSSFGKVEGGANTVISALKNIVTKEGALIMPTFPSSMPFNLTDKEVKHGITMKVKRLSPDSKERTSMGIISDTFKFLPGVVTGEGEHRVSAWGKDANKHSKGFDYLLDSHGWALLIGVDIYRLTSMHYKEGKLPQEVREIFKVEDKILKDYPPDEWILEAGVPPVKAWYKIQDEANRRGYIKHHTIGKSKCMFFKVRDVVDIYAKALEENPLELYGLK